MLVVGGVEAITKEGQVRQGAAILRARQPRPERLASGHPSHLPAGAPASGSPAHLHRHRWLSLPILHHRSGRPRPGPAGTAPS